jgi:RimJ/RimL family protein N-acetyltransferase
MSDAQSVANLIGTYDVAKMLSRVPYPYALSDAEEFLSRQIEGKTDEHMVFGIQIKAGPEDAIGAIGVHGEDEPDGVAELGYWIGEPYWGKGFVSEAAHAAVAYAFTELELSKLVAGHFLGNEGSRKILLKLGFTDIGVSKRPSQARGQEVDCADLVLTRETWANSQ